MSKTILVAEDDARIADLICKYLDMEKFTYHKAYSGLEAIALFEKCKPDLVVLDIMLPQVDGATVCERIRAMSDVPIIMVTALGNDEDRLQGFAKGADDYVCKPFNPRELMARIKAILRRLNPGVNENSSITCGAIYLNPEERNVKVDGETIDLTQIEFNILTILMSHPNRVLSREELLDGSHEKYSESYNRSVDFHIKNLRRKINFREDLKYIKAVYGVGYKLM
jgi:two-component system response regulator BaeR